MKTEGVATWQSNWLIY